MILDQISLLDCFVFLLFLTPQLLFQVGLYDSIKCALSALPFLLIHLPIQLTRGRINRIIRPSRCSPFVIRATLFQDIVIRCVRYAFAEIPAAVGAVFFSKHVALPFMRFRMLRHGYFRGCPLHWEEVTVMPSRGSRGSKGPDGKWTESPAQDSVKGLWLIADPTRKPDVIVYYCHGGGFSMGSSYFYLEFLLAWLTLLIEDEMTVVSEPAKGVPPLDADNPSRQQQRTKRYSNPAILALEYSLVPTEIYPTQVRQTLAGYEYCLSRVLDAESKRICVAGDSAGATLILSLLLVLAGKASANAPLSLTLGDSDVAADRTPTQHYRPGFATLISPWCTLVSERNRDTPSDFLNAASLHMYARQYVGDLAAAPTPAAAAPLVRRLLWRPAPATPAQARSRTRHSVQDSVASPGDCFSRDMWARAAPSGGVHVLYGSEEVFAPETRVLAARLRQSGCVVRESCEQGGIHAWPVVSLFLGRAREERLEGLREAVRGMAEGMDLRGA